MSSMTKVIVPEDAAMAAFRKGLIPGSPLRKDLNIREPKDLDDALHRASKFALDEEEEAQIAAKTNDEQPSHPPKVKNRVEHHEPRKHHEPQDRKKGVIHAVSEVDDQEKQPSDPKELYCDFHMYPGHSTHECVHLKNYLYAKYLSGEVEATYQPKSARGGRGRRGGWHGGRSNRGCGAGGGRGYDGPPNAVQQPANQAPVNHQEEAPQVDELPGPPKRQRGQNPERVNSPPRGRITMILGPPEDCADSVRALKKRARQVCALQTAPTEPSLCLDPISFTSEDAKGTQHPHSDPLVIEVSMGDFDVERVLIDTGSTVNVLCWQTLEKIGVTPDQLKPETRTLTGYDGVAKMSMGDVKLQVRAGGVTRKTKFVVVDAPPIYNAILGVPWIYAMQAVPSTYHLCLKFPTTTGICTLYGDQRVARVCSVIEKKQRKTEAT
ncbi:PREDICTED: uncharacterized protein LOC104748645 [Camelina sativa]|uniref:Uncharacterized protein LOC104748645 n=1 Tax=Camelina sativa TaxID=90675 RepID=A0ABM0WBD5_CAMSA|nr:PREDICTED: uncharacterized protein LOC104748645 [Camelina sativa]